MKNKNKSGLLILIFMCILSGCMKPDDDPDNQAIPVQYPTTGDAGIEDPYAIDNILRALSNLKMKGVEIPANIKANHLYLKFTPSDEEELDLLKKDTTIQFFDYPLHSEMTVDMTSVQDTSSIAGSGTLIQYCVVPSGKELPAIPHEVIYEVFIPPDENEAKGSYDEMISFYDELEQESARLTGNLTEDGSDQEREAKGLLPSRWTPHGTVRVWDDLLGQFIPVPNVRVHARWFTHVETAVTDENG